MCADRTYVVTGNTTHRFRNTALLTVSRVDAPRVVTSDELDERLGGHLPAGSGCGPG